MKVAAPAAKGNLDFVSDRSRTRSSIGLSNFVLNLLRARKLYLPPNRRVHASIVSTARTMPFSPHSILQEIVRLFDSVATKISEKVGGSEYDNL